ncbi:hypothetical protein ACFL6S_34265 [Candidatus Poribacteria bacterium]
MTKLEIKLDDIKELANKLPSQTSAVSKATLKQFAELQERRSSRLAAAGARVTELLGEDHPRVAALNRVASSAEKLRNSMSDAVARQESIPKIKPDEWLVAGRVLDAGRRPIPNLRIHLYDEDLISCDDLLGISSTDEYGGFALVYNKKSFSRWGEKLPDLYMKIEDSEDKLLFSSRNSVRYDSGRIEYYEITLADVEISGEDMEASRKEQQ